MLKDCKRVHFIGIGGVGMSGLASALLKAGFLVTGSDIAKSSFTERVEAHGGKVYIGHRESNLDDATDYIVYSTCIGWDNPEIMKAKRKNIPIIHRGKLLAEIMRDKLGIAITGAHGKTTTTALVHSVLKEGGLRPTSLIGGELRNAEDLQGGGEYVVAEADESDGSFLELEPLYAVITNIDAEHLDYYGTFEKLVEANILFANKIKKGGCLFYCYDDENTKRALTSYKGKRKSYGLSKDADFYATNINLNGLGSDFKCVSNKFELRIPGIHNVVNATAAIAIGLELGVAPHSIKKALALYKGVARRFEIKIDLDGIMVVEDYAHHPKEIEATLASSKGLNKSRTIAIFQPHRYTRTQHLFREFAKVLSVVDKLILTDIYAAFEEPIPGISSENILEEVLKSGHKDAVLIPKEKIVDYLAPGLRPGDIVFVLGAGNIGTISDRLAECLRKTRLQVKAGIE